MRRLVGPLLALASGLLYAAAQPPFGRALLAFVALAPLTFLALAPRARLGRLFLLGWLAGTIACSLLVTTSVVAAAQLYFGMAPLAAWAAGLVVPQLYGAPYFGLFAMLAGALARAVRGPVARALLCAAAWVACDLLRSQVGDGCPWILLGHALHARPVLLQVADLGGVAAVSFVVALVGAALAIAARALVEPAPGRARTIARALLVATTALAATVAYGRVQLARWSAAGPETLRVALVQGNLPEAWRYSLAAQGAALRRLAELTAGATSPPPDLVVWPENAISVAPDASSADFAAAIRTLPAGARLLVGAPRAQLEGVGRASLHNAAFLIAPDGTRTPAYDKLRLTPWAEAAPWPLGALGLWSRDPAAYQPGGAVELPEVRGRRFGVSICAEAIDAALVRDQVRRGATFLVNIANDGWFGGRPAVAQHAAAALLRAVESRRPLVRVAATGISQVVGADGVVSATIPSGVAGALAATITPRTTITLATRGGDAFAWLCVAAVAAALLLARRTSAGAAR